MKSGSFKAAINMLGPVAWLAFAAGLQMLGALLFFKLSADLILVFTYFFIAFSIYLFNRFTDDEDSYNNPDQKIYFQRRSSLKAIPAILFLLSITVLALSDRLVLWHMILIVGGILYSASVIPFFKKKSIHFIRLKDILFVKNAVVGLLWGITPFAIAAGQKGSHCPMEFDLFVVILAFCLVSFIDTVTCDVQDIKGDRHAGISTLATRFGEKMTALFLLALGTVGCLFVGMTFLLGKVSTPSTILFFTICLWTGIVTLPIFLKKINLSISLIKPLLDSQCVFCGLALILFSLVF